MESENYHPPQEILDKYADVLVNFAINSGEGINPGEVVYLHVPENAKPFLISLRRAVLKSGAHPIIRFMPDDMSKEYYDLANEEQLTFFPEKALRGKIEQTDHSVSIRADTNPHELKDIDPKKIMMSQKAGKPYYDWHREKENQGKLTWVLASYGTEAMAKEANLSLEEYWDQIIRACHLDYENPIQKWKETIQEIQKIKGKLDNLQIKKLKIKSENIDLIIGLGKNRKWLGGDCRNIPGFEIFISPDYILTQGYIKLNQPLYRYGSLIKDIYLEFKDGEIVKATASKGEDVLKEMIKVPGANHIGEFSLTDTRLSRIDKFMADTVFEENFGGEHGSMHIALGSAYRDSYPEDQSKPTKEEWEQMGYNDSVVHTDIVSTENRKVIAILEDDSEIVIYEDGKFTV